MLVYVMMLFIQDIIQPVSKTTNCTKI